MPNFAQTMHQATVAKGRHTRGLSASATGPGLQSFHLQNPAAGVRLLLLSGISARQSAWLAEQRCCDRRRRQRHRVRGVRVWATAVERTETGTQELGPAARATLKALDWAALTSHVADFANTRAGRQACIDMQARNAVQQAAVPDRPAPNCTRLQIHSSQEGAEQAARQSRSVDALEHKYAVQLDFGGIASEQVAQPHAAPQGSGSWRLKTLSSQASEGLGRASRGGILAASQAHAVLGLLRGAQRLQRTIVNAATKHSKHPEDFAPLLQLVQASLAPSKSLSAAAGQPPWHSPGSLCCGRTCPSLKA